jgi:hypothetical protein
VIEIGRHDLMYIVSGTGIKGNAMSYPFRPAVAGGCRNRWMHASSVTPHASHGGHVLPRNGHTRPFRRCSAFPQPCNASPPFPTA